MNWLSIRRKRLIGCQFEERVNQPPVISHQTSLSKKGTEVPSTFYSLFNFLETEVGWIIPGGFVSLFELTADSPFSQILLPITLFLKIYCSVYNLKLFWLLFLILPVTKTIFLSQKIFTIIKTKIYILQEWLKFQQVVFCSLQITVLFKHLLKGDNC